uniref:Sodium-independent sulfate anion transporter n=1 Tax=Neolamprologus brichardi TaxID=32507 RepID=A0A3Q4IAA4_NEOBR
AEPHFGSTLKAWLPILSWLPKYNLKWLKMDVLAGLTVGLTTVPQALAYAEVAGLPVQFGLYSAFMGGFIYTFLGTSKDVTLGPTAIMSLLCFSVVGGQPHRAVLLSLLCGLIQAVMALLRLGEMSAPEVMWKNILGIQGVPQQFFLEVYYTFHKIPEARIGDVVLGLICLALLVMLMFMKSSLTSDNDSTCSMYARKVVWAVATMRNAAVVIVASLLAFSWEVYGNHVFTITGKTTRGLPPFRPPPTSDTTANGTVVSFGEIVKDFGGGLAVIPFMGLLESIAIAKDNYNDGGNSLTLIKISISKTLIADKLDLLPFFVTFLMSFWEVQYGIVGGIAVSGALLLYSMARPQIEVTDQGVLVMELSSGLTFPATEYLSHIIHTRALQVSPPRSVVLDCSHVSVIDYTVISELRDLLRQFKLREVHLIFAGLQPSILKVLLAADLEGLRHNHSVDEALQMESRNLLDD